MNMHYAIVHDRAFLVASGYVRARTWQRIQRAIRYAPATPGRPVQPNERLIRIARADLGCAYAAPGIFEIETDVGRSYTVVLS